MKVMAGNGYRKELPDNHHMDISVYQKKWTTHIGMSLWHKEKSGALAFADRTYFNFDRILPQGLATKIATRLLNKQSQEVAKIDLIEVKE